MLYLLALSGPESSVQRYQRVSACAVSQQQSPKAAHGHRALHSLHSRDPEKLSFVPSLQATANKGNQAPQHSCKCRLGPFTETNKSNYENFSLFSMKYFEESVNRNRLFPQVFPFSTRQHSFFLRVHVIIQLFLLAKPESRTESS